MGHAGGYGIMYARENTGRERSITEPISNSDSRDIRGDASRIIDMTMNADNVRRSSTSRRRMGNVARVSASRALCLVICAGVKRCFTWLERERKIVEASQPDDLTTVDPTSC